MKLFPYILSEKYINILALEMASLGNRHCASCIPMKKAMAADQFRADWMMSLNADALGSDCWSAGSVDDGLLRMRIFWDQAVCVSRPVLLLSKL